MVLPPLVLFLRSFTTLSSSMHRLSRRSSRRSFHEVKEERLCTALRNLYERGAACTLRTVSLAHGARTGAFRSSSRTLAHGPQQESVLRLGAGRGAWLVAALGAHLRLRTCI